MGRTLHNIRLPNMKTPTEADISEILKKNAEMPGPPPTSSLVEDGCEEHLRPALKIKLPQPFTALFSKDLVGRSLPDLIQIATELNANRKFSSQEIEAVCSLTANQSLSKHWMRHRAFKLTASVYKAVVRTSFDKVSLSLLKQVCYPNAYKFSNEATR